MPTVSVIMPCYNHGRFLRASIEGVLCQNYSDLELIIINDHSTDDSGDIIESYKKIDKRISCIQHKENVGVSESRNAGLLHSKGEFIGFCDSDDVWMPEKLSIQLRDLVDKGYHKIVYCDSMVINEDGVPTGVRFSSCFGRNANRSGNIFADLCLSNFINTQTVLFRKQCLIGGELFERHISCGEDWMFWIGLARRHTFLYIDEVLAKYRVHSESTAVIRPRGYIVDRIKVYNQVLTKYADLPSKIRSRVLYETGVAHAQLGEKKTAKGYFIRSLMIDRRNFRALVRLFLPKANVTFED